MYFDIHIDGVFGTYKVIRYKWQLYDPDNDISVKNGELIDHLTSDEKKLYNIMTHPYVYFERVESAGHFRTTIELTYGTMFLLTVTPIEN
jgi:hypothetical protein